MVAPILSIAPRFLAQKLAAKLGERTSPARSLAGEVNNFYGAFREAVRR
jgi:hypothetical protein